AVQAHRQLQPDPGPSLLHAFHEADVQLDRLVLHQPGVDGDACSAKRGCALTTDQRIGVLYCKHDATDASRDQCVDAGRRSAEVAARLQSDVNRGTGRVLTRGAQGSNLGVRLAGSLMPTLAYDPLAMGNDTPDTRVGIRRLHAASRELQSASH